MTEGDKVKQKFKVSTDGVEIEGGAVDMMKPALVETSKL